LFTSTIPKYKNPITNAVRRIAMMFRNGSLEKYPVKYICVFLHYVFVQIKPVIFIIPVSIYNSQAFVYDS